MYNTEEPVKRRPAALSYVVDSEIEEAYRREN
jgi:hypothetical protein